MKWTELRPIQTHAIHEVLQGEKHLIISAMTAGGKTEAAFLPILSTIVDSKDTGVRALYIGPLKALINDQFRRLEDLCERADIPVHKWHGDVGASAKKELLAKPSGVLLITPESIESLFVNRPKAVVDLFRSLSFIVMDEMHSFMGTERGAHLKSLMARIAQLCQNPPRLIGLSATIGDRDMAKQWLCPREPGAVNFITGEGERTIKYLIKGYVRTTKITQPQPEDTECGSDVLETDGDRRLAGDVIRRFYGTTALIFANSRKRLEFYADLTRRLLEKEGRPNPLRIHHGSLSKAEREDTEEALRSSSPTATFCSSTLELGIDVGNVSAIGQIGAPWSVSSLVQRLGRSGRRHGEAAVLVMYIEEDDPSEWTNPVHRLCPKFLQAVAMTELVLDKWCEPPDAKRLHLSTLIQQILSVIAERGGASAEGLHNLLVKKGAFTGVPLDMFLDVLRSIGAHDLIEQTPERDLILGLEGEKIVRSSDFYSAFASSQEMKVFHKEHLIGTADVSPGMGGDSFIILAGRRWRILEIDQKRQEVLVEPAKGGRLPTFSASGGADIHPRVRKEMVNVLESANIPRYLDSEAQGILSDARAFAKTTGILKAPFVTDGQETYWFTWTGSRINRTLMGLGRFVGGLDVRDEDVALCFTKADAATVRSVYASLLKAPPDVIQVAEQFPVQIVEKYDAFLSEDTLAANFARNNLDMEGAVAFLKSALA